MKYCRKQPVEAIQWRGDNQNEVHQLASKAVEGCYTADDSDSNLHVAYWDDKKRKHLAAIPKFGWVVVEGKTLQFYKDKTFRQTFKSAEDEGSKVDDKSEPSILDLARQTDKGSNKRLMEILGKSFEDMTHSEIVVDHFGAPIIPVRKDVVDAIKEAVLRSSNKTPETNTDDVIGRMILKECTPFISETLGKVRDSVEKAFNDKIREEKYKSAWEDSEGNIHYNESTPEQIELKAMCKEFMDNYKKMLDAWIDGGIEADANKLQKYAVNEKDVESDTFDSVLDEMRDLHAKKNADYGDAAHVNFLKYGPVASLSRLSEKMQRAEHIFLSGKNEVKDEPLTATLIDMAITSAMLYMELKNQKK